jgi:hypothetical protein
LQKNSFHFSLENLFGAWRGLIVFAVHKPQYSFYFQLQNYFEIID